MEEELYQSLKDVLSMFGDVEPGSRTWHFINKANIVIAKYEGRPTKRAADGVTGCACKPELPYLLTGDICSECKLPRR